MHDAIIAEILDERLPPRRHRRYKRGVKRKMSNYPIRRKSDPAMQSINILAAIKILN